MSEGTQLDLAFEAWTEEPISSEEQPVLEAPDKELEAPAEVIDFEVRSEAARVMVLLFDRLKAGPASDQLLVGASRQEQRVLAKDSLHQMLTQLMGAWDVPGLLKDFSAQDCQIVLDLIDQARSDLPEGSKGDRYEGLDQTDFYRTLSYKADGLEGETLAKVLAITDPQVVFVREGRPSPVLDDSIIEADIAGPFREEKLWGYALNYFNMDKEGRMEDLIEVLKLKFEGVFEGCDSLGEVEVVVSQLPLNLARFGARRLGPSELVNLSAAEMEEGDLALYFYEKCVYPRKAQAERLTSEDMKIVSG